MCSAASSQRGVLCDPSGRFEHRPSRGILTGSSVLQSCMTPPESSSVREIAACLPQGSLRNTQRMTCHAANAITCTFHPAASAFTLMMSCVLSCCFSSFSRSSFVARGFLCVNHVFHVMRLMYSPGSFTPSNSCTVLLSLLRCFSF